MGKFNCDKCDGPLDPSVWRICDNCKAEEKSADERLRHEWEEQQEAYRKRVRELEAGLRAYYEHKPSRGVSMKAIRAEARRLLEGK